MNNDANTTSWISHYYLFSKRPSTPHIVWAHCKYELGPIASSILHYDDMSVWKLRFVEGRRDVVYHHNVCLGENIAARKLLSNSIEWFSIRDCVCFCLFICARTWTISGVSEVHFGVNSGDPFAPRTYREECGIYGEMNERTETNVPSHRVVRWLMWL